MFSKQAVLALFLAGSQAQEAGIPIPPIPASAKTAEKIVEGLLKGTIDEEQFTNINTCLKDGSTVVNGVEEVIGDFKAGGISNIIKGIQDFGVVLGELQTSAGDCVKSKKDIQKLEEMAAIFKQPQQLAIQVMKDV